MTLRSLAAWIRWTPLHPQWLLGRRKPPSDIRQIAGIVLDIGSADRWIEPYLSSGVQYIALDYPETGRELYGAKPDIFADGSRLPIRDSSIDNVVCFDVIEHVKNPEAMLFEIVRVLKPGGCVFLTMPFLYPIHDAPFDFQRFTKYGWFKRLEELGLVQIKVQSHGHAVGVAAMLACLAIAGSIPRQNPFVMLLLSIIASPIIVFINLCGALGSIFWPNWDAMAQGYEINAKKQ